MKAVFIESHGDPSVIQFGEMPDPNPGPGQIMVKVRAASVNRLDLYTRAGLRGTKVPDDEFPRILGGDCAGTIEAVGEGVDDFAIGQSVVVNPVLSVDPFPRMIGTHQQGSHAELVVVPAVNAVPMDTSLDFAVAASLPTVYLPTWGIIIREGKLLAEETAVVLSASSGVGTAAIQIVKGVVGAQCIAVTSTAAKAERALHLGADHVINYNEEDLGQRIKDLTGGRGADLVVDSTGALLFEAAYGALARGGRFGTCGVTSGYLSQIHLGHLFTKQLKVFGTFMGSQSELGDIVSAATQGKITTAFQEIAPLSEAARIHEQMEKSEHFGKFVLTSNQ